MTFTIKTTDARKAAEELRKAMKNFATDKFVTVGIHEDAGVHPDTEMTNATLGALLHFGTDKIPARPWLDAGVRAGNARYTKIISESLKNDVPLDGILNILGPVAAGEVQKFMTELRTPPNDASTIARKKSSNPLIDTGALRASVTWKIQTGKPQEGLE